ncbi:hypothetical protein YDYSG_15960 [Paenibacillus tyrfis]|nr:hypothetical protein YDYSG_15960 [Paenibacillus tyrfis]
MRTAVSYADARNPGARRGTDFFFKRSCSALVSYILFTDPPIPFPLMPTWSETNVSSHRTYSKKQQKNN